MKRSTISLLMSFALATLGLLAGGQRLLAQPGVSSQADAVIASQRAIRRVLDRPITVACDAMPLSQFLRMICRHAGVEVAIEIAELEDDGIDIDAPISLHVAGISAASALSLGLRQHELRWLVENEVVLVTTAVAHYDKLFTRVYPVGDLVTATRAIGSTGVVAVAGHEPPFGAGFGGAFWGGANGAYADFDSLIETMITIVYPDSWNEAGGPATIVPDGLSMSLVVTQTEEVHATIESLLATLRRFQGVPREGAGVDAIGPVDGTSPDVVRPLWVSAGTPREIANESAIRRAMAKPISLACEAVPLWHFNKRIALHTGVNVVIDTTNLADEGVESTARITLRVRGISVASAFSLGLRQHGLQWLIKNEVVVVTTTMIYHEQRLIRIYPVGDLVQRSKPRSTIGIEAVGGGWSQHDAGWNRNDFGMSRSPDADYDTLIEVILSAIEPDSWEENGGDGSISPFEPTRLLMVAQRADVHARIERLLARLRQVRGLNR